MGPKRNRTKLSASNDDDAGSSQLDKKRNEKASRKVSARGNSGQQGQNTQQASEASVNGAKKQKTEKNSQKQVTKEETQEPEELIDGDIDEDLDADADDYGEEKSDCRYKIPHLLTIYITLPNGDEEIITDYEMCFTDKTTKGEEQNKEEAKA